MRNSLITRTSIIFFILSIASLAGCEADAKSKSELSAGYQSLEARNYDVAIAAADSQLERSPTGAGAAEALYLRGRALEQKPAASADEARTQLRSAQKSYIEALSHHPAPRLEAYIRTSLANVQYFLDDYTSALREWRTAYDRLDDPTVKSWVLYRIGLCHQRLGQFEQADKVFAQVQQDHPNTIPAQRARDHQGARSFTVQLATYAKRDFADSAMNLLKREGVMPIATTDPQGRTVVRVGPLTSYQQAAALKQRYAARYPDALILP